MASVITIVAFGFVIVGVLALTSFRLKRAEKILADHKSNGPA